MTGFSPSLRFAGLLLAFLAADTATQMAFKAAADGIGDVPLSLSFVAAVAATPSAWIAVALYGATYVLWMVLLKDRALSLAFPLTALSYVTVPLLSWLVFGEAIGPRTILGIGLILLGVSLIGAEPESEPAPAVAPVELRQCGS